MTDRVLVTGATGFIAQHCILQLLEAGYEVRGTARTDGRRDEIARILTPKLSAGAASRLDVDFQMVAADLTSDVGWDLAVKDCRYVLHVASPLPRNPPRNDDELIIPAREGTLRVLRAARDAGVQRVVLTSSIAAIIYGVSRDKVFDESDWSNVDGPRIGAYEKSKTISERAAWDYMATITDDCDMELTVINPGLVLGPLLCADWGTSGELVKKILDRDVPAIPDIHFACVDVRDVASAHVAAMITPGVGGRRFICAIEDHSMMDVALILRDHLASRGFKVPTKRLPSFVIRLMALWDGAVRLALNDLGTHQRLDNSSIKRELGWSPRGLAEMTTAMADSMIEFGVVAAPR